MRRPLPTVARANSAVDTAWNPYSPVQTSDRVAPTRCGMPSAPTFTETRPENAWATESEQGRCAKPVKQLNRKEQQGYPSLIILFQIFLLRV
jgi:hypothetical protein